MFTFAYRKFTAVAFSAAIIAASSASATTVITNFGGTAANAGSFTYVSPSLTLTAQARSFAVLPSALTALSQLSSAGLQVSRTAPGIGVNGGASGPQIDTNQPARREGILLSANRDFAILGLKLSFVDTDDTLQIYGVSGSALVALGFPGVIRAGLAAPNSSLSLLGGQATGPAFSSANSGTQSLTLLTPTPRFSSYFLTTREPGNASFLGTLGQGYRVDAITAGVPDTASWALLIAGFGLVGSASRRRRHVVAA